MFVPNRDPLRGAALDPADARSLGPGGLPRVRAFLAACGEPRATPLHALPSLAREAGVASLHLKDEADRLGLGSFKALGGSYATVSLVLEAVGQTLSRPLSFADLHAPDVRAAAGAITVACATDGNHGRAVAAGATRIGAQAVVFVHQGVSAGRAAAIASFGARIVRIPGNYDDSIAAAAQACEAEGWTLVSDTSWPGYEGVSSLVMQGYTVLADEALSQLPEPPTHVFLQAGVGGLAAAVAGHFAEALGEGAPRVVVVEPARAACLAESARAGAPIRIPEGEATVMAMLECYEPSHVAWRVLTRTAWGFMTVEEADAVAIMRRLGRPGPGEPVIVAGESGGVGVAGLLRAAADPELRQAIGLGPGSRVLAINSEGATDPERYRLLVGREPALSSR
jgi:diaminopropionate ammonia-lyase